jgi:uncharacterized membrane protein (UPF0136 family)
MLIYIYAISFITSLSGLIGWFYAKENAQQSRLLSSLFLGGFFVYLFSLAFANVAFEQKLWVLFRDLVVLGLTSQFFSFFKKNKLVFFGLIAVLYVFIGVKHWDTLVHSFDNQAVIVNNENQNIFENSNLDKDGELLVEVKIGIKSKN